MTTRSFCLYAARAVSRYESDGAKNSLSMYQTVAIAITKQITKMMTIDQTGSIATVLGS